MCGIVDNNVANEVFGGDPPEPGKRFRRWLGEGNGRLAVGGQLLAELKENSRFREWFQQNELSGRLLQVRDEEVTRQERRIRRTSLCTSMKECQFLRPRPELHAAIAGLERVVAISRIGNAFAFTFLPTRMIYNEKTVIFPLARTAPFTVLQSRVHEVLSRFFGSTLKDDLQYTPSDCLETFAFPES